MDIEIKIKYMKAMPGKYSKSEKFVNTLDEEKGTYQVECNDSIYTILPPKMTSKRKFLLYLSLKFGKKF